MAQVQSHRELIVWQKAMDLAVSIYEVSKAFPREEMYGLTSQVRRAAVSVPANIAEGSARVSAKDYCNFLATSQGSLRETETFVTLAVRLGYLQEADVVSVLGLVAEISKMLTSIRTKLSA